MEKLKKWMKEEVDVEFFCCVWAVAMIFIYGFELYIYGEKATKFVIIFQMFILSYLIARFQKMLFKKEQNFSKTEFLVRAILWSLVPMILTCITAAVFKWFVGYPMWILLVFYGTMAVYYACIWIILQIFYKDETNQLNDMLERIKKNNEGEIR